ncbi:MAG: WecB/TagA/CpsF family glycosyltransferase, partial [Colwellia sp.]
MNLFSVVKPKITCIPSSFKEGSLTFLNLFSYMKNRSKARMFDGFDSVGVDGIMLVLAFRLFGVKTERMSFDYTSIAGAFFKYCVAEDKKLFIVGSEQKYIEGFVEKTRTKYENLNVAGYRNGFFLDSLERDMCYKKINESGSEYLLVGMGSPYQEEFVLGLKQSGWTGNAITCGGFIHQTAGAVG